METKKNVLTQKGLQRYEEELQELKVVPRKEVAQKIKDAREQGDLLKTRNMMLPRMNSGT